MIDEDKILVAGSSSDEGSHRRGRLYSGSRIAHRSSVMTQSRV